MAIFELTKESIVPVAQTTFSSQHVRERYDLQRILRCNIGCIAPETYVLAEEYGEWEDSKRRIDLLCLDKDANIVIVELKRTEDGGHMELQAIRYAAMVSKMTFAQAVEAHAEYLKGNGKEEDATTAILRFLDWEEPRETEFAQDIRIVLVSGDFSKEITTSVLWLNERGLDIRCVRLRPYSLAERTLLDIQQVIPLPEASAYQVQLRKKAEEERQAKAGGADWTRYDLYIGDQFYPSLYKRALFFRVIQTLIKQGVTPEQIMEFVPRNKFLVVPGRLSCDEFKQKAAELRGTDPSQLARRYYVAPDELFFVNGSTYAVTNQWSIHRMPALDALLLKHPESGIRYEKAATEE